MDQEGVPTLLRAAGKLIVLSVQPFRRAALLETNDLAYFRSVFITPMRPPRLSLRLLV